QSSPKSNVQGPKSVFPSSSDFGLLTLDLSVRPYNCIDAGSDFLGIDLIFLNEFDIKAEGLQLTHKHIERLRYAGFEIRNTFDDRFVDLRASGHVIGFACKQFLKDVRRD